MRTLRGLRNEEGIALVMALGVMFVLTIAAVAVIQFSTSNSRSASYNRSNNQAEGYAEAGVNFARSVLWQASDPTTLANFSNTAVVEGRTVQYSGTYDSASRTWTLTGVSTLPSPSGTKQITRTVTTQVLVEYTETWDTNSLAVWDRLFANNPNGCIDLKNNNSVSRSIYSRGGLCLKNNDYVSAPVVEVEKGINTGNNTGITTDSLQVGGGCGTNAQGKPLPCNNGGGINAKASDVKPQGLVKPPLDLSTWYTSASPGPKSNCTTGSFPGGFDNDAVMNGSRGTVSVTPSASYTCRTATGELSWNTTTDVLTIKGVVLIDGSVSFGNSLRVQGEGSLYANGNIDLGNNVELCSTPSCDGTGLATGGNRLALVAASNVTAFNNNVVEAAIYAGGDFESKNNGSYYGPIVADEIYLKNNSNVAASKFGVPLAGMPGNKTTTIELKNVSGTTRMS